MVIDVQATSRQYVGQMDAFLLLLAARNAVQFREEEWKWHATAELAERVQKEASKTIDKAMFDLRKEQNAQARETRQVQAAD